MAETNETKTSTGMEQISRYSIDLLERFMASGNRSLSESVETTSGEKGSEEIELNLGLSMGGQFGVDKSEKKKLIRSSSIAECFPIVRDDDYINPSPSPSPPVSNPTLVRTSSLPVETEMEWRKRKELQTLRRMEAKRRRSEKQRNKDGGGDGGERSFEEERREIEANLRGRIERGHCIVAGNRFGPGVVPPFGLPNWAVAARQAILAAAGGGGGSGGGGVLQGFGQPSPRGSVESQGGSSSGMSDLESKPLQGSSSCGEGSLASTQSLLQERGNQETAGSSGTKAKENENSFLGSEPASQSKRTDVREIRGKEVGANALEDMPCVFTKGDGPNGRRIEGILYRFGKGEEVRIMCVCHGSFLSPAEFVKHAGGTDVAHPLKHIVMNPNSSSSLL